MSGRSSLFRLVVVLTVILGLRSPAVAVDPGVYAVSGAIQSSPADAAGLVRTLTGNITPFGEVRGELRFTARGADGSFTATLRFTQPDGTIEAAVSGQFTSPTEYVEVVSFTKGTGAYRGIRGLVVLNGTLSLTTGRAEDVIAAGFVFIPGR